MNPRNCRDTAEIFVADLVQRGALRPQLRQQRVGVPHQADHLVGALGQHPRRFGGVVEQTAELGVALVECLRKPRHPLHSVLQVRRGIGKGLRQGGQRPGQLVGVQPADRGGQVAKGVGQLVGRHRPLHRDGTLELAVAAGCDVEDLAAQQAFGFDRRLGAIAETNVLGDVELDQHARTRRVRCWTPCRPENRRPRRRCRSSARPRRRNRRRRFCPG